MKTRQGFVSNSSSSSFIIRSNQIEIAESYGLKLYSINTILKILKKKINTIKKQNLLLEKQNFPTYFEWQYPEIFEDTNLSSLENLYNQFEKYKNDYITNSYDRDEAYRLDFPFIIFDDL